MNLTCANPKCPRPAKVELQGRSGIKLGGGAVMSCDGCGGTLLMVPSGADGVMIHAGDKAG